MKTIVGVLILVAVVGVAASRYWQDRFPTETVFETAQVTRGDLETGVTATGTVEPMQIIDVGAQIVGSIQSFGEDPERPGKPVDYRSRVRKGTVLARLDDLPHKAELEKATVNELVAEAEMARCMATEKRARQDFERSKKLRNVETPADFDRKESEFEIAKAEVAIAQAKLEQARISKKQAGINLTYTVVTSPVDGVVIDRRVNVGQTVVAGMNAPSLFLLAEDLSEMLVWAAVNEADIGEIHEGQPVKFSVDAYPDRTFTGKVKQIRLNASLQQNVVTYGVIVDVDNSDGKLLPYMTAKLQFEVERRTDIVLVPNQALRWQPTWDQISPAARQTLKKPQASRGRVVRDEDEDAEEPELKVDLGKPTVWVLAADGLVRPVPVEIGLNDGLMTELIQGEVQPGSEVVTHAFVKGQPDFVSSFVSKVVGSGQ